MTDDMIPLTPKQIEEQKNYVSFYQRLINKEIDKMDLAKHENIKYYCESILIHLNLIKYPYVKPYKSTPK